MPKIPTKAAKPADEQPIEERRQQLIDRAKRDKQVEQREIFALYRRSYPP